MEPTQLSPGFHESQCCSQNANVWEMSHDRVTEFFCLKFAFRLHMQIRRYVRTTFVFARDSDDIFCCHSFNFCDKCVPIIKISCPDDRLRWLVYVLQVLIFEVVPTLLLLAPGVCRLTTGFKRFNFLALRQNLGEYLYVAKRILPGFKMMTVQYICKHKK